MPIKHPIRIRSKRPKNRRALIPAELWPALAIVGTVLIGNGLFLLGVFDPNPINVVSGLGVIAHGGLAPGTFSIDPNNGFTAQALGHLSALDLLHGHIPWWNPFEGLGTPLAGEMQSAALFPATLFLAFSGGQLPFHILLECIAGIATYRLLLRLQVSTWISAACGCAFALNGTFSWFAHAPVNPIAFLPLLLLGIERARDAVVENKSHKWGMIAIALALSLYAGFPEVAYLDGLLAVGWIVARTANLHRGEIVSFIRKIAAGAAVGALVGAPIAVAFTDYLSSADLGDHASGFNNAYLPHAAISMLWFPYSFGSIEGFAALDKTQVLYAAWGNVGGYLTTSILVFALLGLYGRRLRPLRIILLTWIVLCLGRTFGWQPIAKIFSLIPAMNKVAAFRYSPASWELAAIVLVALGIEDIRRKVIPTWYIVIALILAIAVALGALSTGDSLRSELTQAPNFNSWLWGSVGWGFGVIIVAGIGLLFCRGHLRTGILIALLLLDTMVMFTIPQLSAPRKASIDAGPVVWLEHHLGTQRFYTLGPLAPNYASYFGLSSVNINDLPIPKSYARYITSKLDQNVNPTIFTGNTTINPKGPSTLIEFQKNIRNYENIGVAYVLTSPSEVPSQVIQQLKMHLVYADKLTSIYQLPRTSSMYTVRSGNCQLSQATLESVVADCQKTTVIVRRELFMPGWSALADGKPLSLNAMKGNGDPFQLVTVPSGKQTVSFTFLPPHEKLAGLALLIGLGLLLFGLQRGRHTSCGSPLANREYFED